MSDKTYILNESVRSYAFSAFDGEGEIITLYNVHSLRVDEVTGCHHLLMQDGTRAIVRPEWLAILINDVWNTDDDDGDDDDDDFLDFPDSHF